MQNPVKILRKQESSRECVVCGTKNSMGLHAVFYELENAILMGKFTGHDHHQSYPGRVHGGISSAMLDETIGRAIMIHDAGVFGVTVDLEVKFKKPVPIGQELMVLGWVTHETRKTFTGKGEIRLLSGEVAVIATGKYMKLPIDKISETWDPEDWQVVEYDVPLANVDLTIDDLKES